MTAVATLVMEADARSLKQGEAALDGVTGAAARAENAVDRVRPATAQTGAAMGVMGGQAKQLGWQISQIAQQGAVTGNWLGAFAVQLSDIAMIMGTGGVLGIALSTAASVALPLLGMAFGDAGDQAGKLEDALDNLDAAAGRAQKSAAALREAYSGADAQMQSYLQTVSDAEKIALMNSLADTVGKLADRMGALYISTDFLGIDTGGDASELAYNLGLSDNNAKALQEDINGLRGAVGLEEQSAAAQKLYQDLYTVYGTLENMPERFQGIAKALASIGISLDKLNGPAQTLSENLQDIGAWALQANNDIPGVFTTTSKAAKDAAESIVAGFGLGKQAVDALIAAQPGPDFLSTAIDRAATLAGTIWDAANALYQMQGDKLIITGSGAAIRQSDLYGNMGGRGMPSDATAQVDDATEAVLKLGQAAGGAASQIDDAGISLREGAKNYQDHMQAQNDAQIGAINDLGSAVTALTNRDIPGALTGLAQLGRSISSISGMGGMGSALTAVAPTLGIFGAVAGIFGSLFGGGSSGPSKQQTAKKEANQEQYSLTSQLYALQGDTEKLRERELRQLDPTNRALQEHVWALQDAADAAAEAARIESERNGLLQQLYALEGDTEALRALQLEGLDESNRALQEHVWALQDEQAAAEAAAAAEQAIADERQGLQDQLWELQGNTEALRAEQLAALDESNRALQEQIWALQDQEAATEAAAQAAKELADALDPDTFATLLDYQTAQAQALYGWGEYANSGGAPMTPLIPAAPAATGGTGASTDPSFALLQSLLDEVEAMHSELAGYSKTQRDTLAKWDAIGLGTYAVTTP